MCISVDVAPNSLSLPNPQSFNQLIDLSERVVLSYSKQIQAAFSNYVHSVVIARDRLLWLEQPLGQFQGNTVHKVDSEVRYEEHALLDDVYVSLSQHLYLRGSFYIH